MELKTNKDKKVLIVLSVIVGVLIFEITVGFLCNHISTYGVQEWNGFIVPITMSIWFVPLGTGIAFLITRMNKYRKKWPLFRLALYFILTIFPVGICVLCFYNIFVGIK